MGSLARKLARNSLEYSPRLQRDKVIKRMKKLNDDVCNRDLPVWVRMAAYQELRGLKGTMRIKRMGNKKNNGLIYGFQRTNFFNTSPEPKKYQEEYKKNQGGEPNIYKPIVKGNKMIFATGGIYQILKSGSIVKTKIQGNKCIS